MRRLLVALALMATAGSSLEWKAVYLVKNRDHTVRVYDTGGAAVTGVIRLPGVGRVLRVAAADEGFHVVTEAVEYGPDSYFRLRPPRYEPEPADILAGHGLAVTRDGTRAAYMTGAPEHPTLVIRDLRTGRQTTTKSDPVMRLTWTPDGRRLLLSTIPVCDDTSDCVFPETLRFHDSERPVKTFRTITAAPVVTGDLILVPKRGGIIEHYSHDGRLLRRVRTPGEIAQISVRAGRLLVVVAEDRMWPGRGTRLVTGPLTGGEWHDLPWDATTMETAAW
ncbi:hypothetical protein GT755_18330 [Herbidospora sp. NEAU-GS84]|uniref:WD40 repeat domain-containing protein n=1 Tax=Herbidospora solisilvae TaxID=2696284 RepID=A0A7C9J3T7_9ACTN|nr:hypothetical protein [Herbidospora solisilvae]NAS23645.1 hypothetical protein [Herbidospora solisilvae]